MKPFLSLPVFIYKSDYKCKQQAVQLFRRGSCKLPIEDCWFGNYFVLLFPRFSSRLSFLEKLRVWKRSVQLINFPLLRDSRLNNHVDKAKQRGCRFQVVSEAYFAWANRIT